MARDLYVVLLERLEHWEEWNQDHVADIFECYVPSLGEVYLPFADKYVFAKNDMEKKMAQNTGYRKAFEVIDDKVFSLFEKRFQDYFLPFDQHLGTLSTLLIRLVKVTPKNNIDHPLLPNIIEELRSLENNVSTRVKAIQSKEKMKKLIMRGPGFERLETEPPYVGGKRIWIREDELPTVGIIERHADGMKIQKKKNAELILFNDVLVLSCLITKKGSIPTFSQPVGILWIKDSDLGDVMSELDNDYENLLYLVGPENEWVLGFESLKAKNDLVQSLLKVSGLESLASASGGIRSGSYEFSNDERFKYTGEWLDGYFHGKGELFTGSTIYDGYWDYKLKVGWGTYSPTTKKNKSKICGWHWPTLDHIIVSDEMWTCDVLTNNDWDLMMRGAKEKKELCGTLLIQRGKPSSRLIRVKKGTLRIERGQVYGSKKEAFLKYPLFPHENYNIKDRIS
eukprot:TRINITY_DN7230_c0_g1_i3.p1 TRINITY_DN7230_c0_g1~~TRINITY_DN7230_c0_g1_i3.p1  ORF type:complete len:453 (+),score=100.91 TRINITY_DN7230_c0_g1_i3:1032-2390(+)